MFQYSQQYSNTNSMLTSEMVSIYNGLHAFSRSIGHSHWGKQRIKETEDYGIHELTEQIHDVQYGLVYWVVYSQCNLLDGALLHETICVPSIEHSTDVVKLYLMYFKLWNLSLSFYVLDCRCHFNNCIIFNFLSFYCLPEDGNMIGWNV